MGFLSSLLNPAGSVAKYNAAAIGAINQNNDKAIGYLQPYMDQGGEGFKALSDLYGLNGAEAQQTASGMYQKSPGYDFRMAQGIKAIDNSASAKGMRNSGATLKALTQYGQGVADQDYQKWVEGLKGIGGAGLSSAGKAGDVLSGSNNAIGSLYSKIGEAKASQGIAQGNLLGNLFGKALSFGFG